MSKPTRSTLMILPGLFLAIILGVIGAALLDVPKFLRLTRHAQIVDGTVILKERENHMSVWCEYKVDGQMFKSAGRAGDVGKTFEAIQIGEIVPVYYDPMNPAASTIGNPERYLQSSLVGTGVIFIGVTVFFIIFV